MRSLRAASNELRVFVGLARQLAIVAPSRPTVVTNSLAILRVWVADRGWWELPKPVLIRVAYLGQRFDFAAANRSEIQVIKEMFLEKQYSFDGLDPQVIVDLGSHVGASIGFFRATYPDAEIIGMEPDPGAFLRLCSIVKALPGVRVYPWAIAGTTGRLSFRRATQSWASALTDESGPDTIDVEAVTLPDLLGRVERHHVDVLKLDVEGAEWLMFDQPSVFDSCETIVGELHFDRPDQTIERAEKALSGFALSITARMPSRANFVARRMH